MIRPQRIISLTEPESKDLDRFLREFAWHFLIDMGIRELPIDPFGIARVKGWEIYTYKRLSKRISKSITFIKRTYHEEGFVFWSRSEQNYIICYDDDIPLNVVRWTLMHEISHSVFKHVNDEISIVTRVRGIKTDLFEYMADGLTRRVLCPSIVLHDCNAIETTDIMELCDISFEAAGHRSAHMKKLEVRNKWRTSILEIQVENQFMDFIKSYNQKKQIDSVSLVEKLIAV